MPKILLMDRKRVANPVERVYLRQTNAQLILIEKSQNAIHKALNERPQLIMVAESFDGGMGFTVLEGLRKEFLLDTTPIFFMGSPACEDKAITLGATEFLQEPLDKEKLLDFLCEHTALMVRLNSRYPLAAKVTYKREDGEAANSITKDLSEGGLFLKMDPPLGLGEQIDMELALNIRGQVNILKCSGEVVRSVIKDETKGISMTGCSIKFTKNRKQTAEFVADLFKSSGLER